MEFWLLSFLLSHFEDFQSNSCILMFVALILAIFNQKITFRIMFSSQIFTEKVKNWSTKFCFDQIHPLVGFWPCSKIRLSLIHCWSSFSKQLAQSPPIMDRVNISSLIYSLSRSEYKMIWLWCIEKRNEERWKKPLLLYCS